MTTIKATCPTCGEVNLAADEVTLMVCATAPLSSYAFTCASCDQRITKPADDHIVSLLISGGVSPHTWQLPAEAREVHSGPALGYDDLLDFVLWLGMTDDLAAMAAVPQAH